MFSDTVYFRSFFLFSLDKIKFQINLLEFHSQQQITKEVDEGTKEKFFFFLGMSSFY